MTRLVAFPSRLLKHVLPISLLAPWIPADIGGKILSLLQNAFANSSSSLIQAKVTGSVVFVLLPPISYVEFFWAYTLAAMSRGLLVGVGVLAVTGWLAPLNFVAPGWILAFAMLGGGIMGGFGGFTGVLPTLWCSLRRMDKDAQRSIVQNFNLTMQVVTFASYLATGIVDASMLPMFAVVAPAMLIPVLAGAKLYIGISEARFRQIVLGLLTVSGVALLVSSVPQLLKA